MDRFTIIISTRLKNSPVAQTLSELGMEIKYMTLRRGEFVLADRFGVMYLTKDEFVDAIQKRTIYRDMLEFKRAYSDPVVLIEGSDPFHDKALDLPTIQGAVIFTSVLNQLPIVTTENDIETAQLLFMMAAQTESSMMWQKVAPRKESRTPPPLPIALEPEAKPGDNGGDDDSGDPRVSIISRLPDVGPALAEGLLNHFGSLSRLFAAEVDDLKKVDGIGPKRAKKIFAFLNGNQAA